MMKTDRRNMLRQKSFTLIEVMAALLLMAIVLPVALRGVSIATRTASETLKKNTLCSLARNRMAEVIATEEWRSGDAKGVFEDDKEYGWELTVSDGERASLKEIELKVFREDDEDNSLVFSRMVYNKGGD